MSGVDSFHHHQDQYAQARAVLLDALEALQPHIDAITLVGAQAIYLQIGESDDFSIAPFTTDADLAVNPIILLPNPELIQTLQSAHFELSPEPGIWKSMTSGYTVDLLVPESLGGSGRRAAKLAGHGKNIARKVIGLYGALVDYDRMQISSLEPTDQRSFEIAVAGPAALLVAKLYKIWERQGNASREDAKDALDLFRLLRAYSTSELAERFTILRQTLVSQQEADTARTYLHELFADEEAHGAQLVAQAVGGLADRDEVIQSSVILAQDFLDATKPN